MKKTVLVLAAAVCTLQLSAQNPYLPMWEFIPDGEPYVFEDPDNPGSYRVYLYGSHDSLVSEYCGKEQVVWSAPVDDLHAWRYDGVAFTANGDVLYAPDIAAKKDADGKTRYWFYPNNQAEGRKAMVAVGDRPDGPFKAINLSADGKTCEGVLGFDPAVFVDDDGKVYGYWGFKHSYAAELDPETMATVKPGTEIVDGLISGCDEEGDFRFFEASSIRKIDGKYVLVYSRKTADGEFGLPVSNYNMAYAYSDSPLGPFTYGGTVIDCRAREKDDKGETVMTAYFNGNTHGGLAEINGQWWIFYHRQTGTDQFSRQAMVSPVTVKVEKGKGGKVYISEAEYTSEGFSIEGLDPLAKSAAGWACHLTGSKGMSEKFPNFSFSGSYIKAVRKPADGTVLPDEAYSPIINNTAGSIVGYKYFNFDKIGKTRKIFLRASIIPLGVEGKIKVFVDRPYGVRQEIAEFPVSAEWPAQMKTLEAECRNLRSISGRKALYFVFESATEDKSICEFYDFQFYK